MDCAEGLREVGMMVGKAVGVKLSGSVIGIVEEGTREMSGFVGAVLVRREVGLPEGFLEALSEKEGVKLCGCDTTGVMEGDWVVGKIVGAMLVGRKVGFAEGQQEDLIDAMIGSRASLQRQNKCYKWECII